MPACSLPSRSLSRLLASASLLVMINADAVGAPQESPALEQQASEAQFTPLVRPGLQLTRFLDQARGGFGRSDLNLDGKVSAADVEQQRAQAATTIRAMTVSEMLRFDSSGDGIVTRAEVAATEGQRIRINPMTATRAPPDEESIRRRIDEAVATQMRTDTNGDGRIELGEMLAAGRNRAAPVATSADRMLNNVLAFDQNADGATDASEFDGAAERFFRSADSNGDQTLSAEEVDAFRVRNGGQGAQRIEQERLAAQAREHQDCAMPKASDRAQVVLLGAYEPDALSTTTILSQDVAVGTGSITIEPGREPIYLVISTFKPTIWRVSGAVQRLERLVLNSSSTGPAHFAPEEKALVGVIGVPAGKVSFLGKAGCIRHFSEAPSIASAGATALITREAGKAPAVTAAQYQVAGFSVPSGEIQSNRPTNGPMVFVKRQGSVTIQGDTKNVIVETGGAGTLERELRRFSPGGVVTINPEDVVASAPVERYVVLPQQAGLLQLLQSGALKENRGGELLITRKIRMPAELYGAHAGKFLLMRGVPEPDGDIGHSSVISEETGKPIARQIVP